jgi:hypothetical protein
VSPSAFQRFKTGGLTTTCKPRAQQPIVGAYAAWLLDMANGAPVVDRTGNGRDGSATFAGSPMRIPSPIDGKIAYGNTGVPSSSAGPMQVPTANMPAAHFVTTGFTFSFWANWCGYQLQPVTPYEGWWINWSSGNDTYIPWVMAYGVPATPSGAVSFWDGSTSHATGLAHTPYGKWEFCQVSADLSGNAIMMIDAAHVQLTGVALHAPPAEYPFAMVGSPFPTQYSRWPFGAMFDMAVWDRAKSLVEMQDQLAAVS